MQLSTNVDIFVTNRIVTFLEALERRDNVAGQLFKPKPWNRGEGDRMEFSIGALSAVAGIVGERQRIPVVDRAQSGSITRRFVQYGQSFEISKKMKMFSHGSDADEQAREAAKGVNDGWDYDLTHIIFAKSDDASISHRSGLEIDNTGLDGRCPASADHRVTGTGSTPYSNLIGGAGGLPLTTDNYIIGLQLPNQSAVDEYGTPLKQQYMNLTIAQNAEMWRKSRQIHGSDKEPEVFANGINVLATGDRKITVLTHGDTDENLNFDEDLRYRWMLKSDALARLNQMSIAQEPGIALESVDENNLAARVVIDMFGASGVVSWQDKMYSLTTEAP